MSSPHKKQRLRGRPPSSNAEHRRVAAELKTQIESGAWKPFEILPTVRALSEKHQASVCAVRLALEQLAGEGLIARNARRRRMFLAKSSYTMDGRGVVLGVFSEPLVVTEKCGSYSSELHRGILAGCSDRRSPLLIVHAHELQDAQPAGFLDLPLKSILLIGRFTEKNLRAYERLSVPVCSVDTPPGSSRLHSVLVDNVPSAYQATRRLIDAGHRRIAFVQFILYTLRTVDPDSRERKQGFLKACAEAGISNASGHVYNFLPGRDAQYSLLAMLKVRPRYTAAVCVDASSAAVLAREAATAGLKVPHDLGIVCFQGVTDDGPYSGPASNFFTLGRRAVHVAERPKTTPVHERIGTVWRERGSFHPV